VKFSNHQIGEEYVPKNEDRAQQGKDDKRNTSFPITGKHNENFHTQEGMSQDLIGKPLKSR